MDSLHLIFIFTFATLLLKGATASNIRFCSMGTKPIPLPQNQRSFHSKPQLNPNHKFRRTRSSNITIDIHNHFLPQMTLPLMPLQAKTLLLSTLFFFNAFMYKMLIYIRLLNCYLLSFLKYSPSGHSIVELEERR